MNIDVRNIGGGIKRVTAATNEWLPNHVVDNIARDVIETEREFDRFGNRVVFDRWGRAIPVGVARPFAEFDRFGRPITVSVDRPLPLGIGRGINLAEFDRWGRAIPVGVARPLPVGIGRGINFAEFDRFGRPLPVGIARPFAEFDCFDDGRLFPSWN